MKILSALLLFVLLFLPSSVNSQGKVYFVLGSDTAIWDGMNTAKFNCYYNLNLYKADNTNTVTVMSESFRNNIIDSYGNKLKMTWWMMAGNIFRYATNNNVPVPNTMTLHLMKKYHGDKVTLWGDELSLHYHTFSWTDYDNDGKYWWNQAHDFLETKDDFNYTLAQFLLEENVFPVSFRSGWHYMDNNWQNYLNEILPYSLHNDYPHVRNSTEEPIDNVYNWSISSPEFVPFRPLAVNYQLPGSGKGWNVRSKYMGSVTEAMIYDIFMKAAQGTDQVACFWSHLPDQNFINEIQQVTDLIKHVSLDFSAVKFRYSTAVEAFQLWLKNIDTIKPNIELTEENLGAEKKFIITTNEEIFQKQPFVAIKDKDEQYFVANCEQIATNKWKTVESFPTSKLGKIGVAVTDLAGNLNTTFSYYLPDDVFIDNSDSEYTEISGNWSTSIVNSWHLDSRIATLNLGDSAKARWDLTLNNNGLKNIFIQFPLFDNHVDSVRFHIYKNGIIDKTIDLSINNKYRTWIYLTTLNFEIGNNYFAEMLAFNTNQNIKLLAADAIKITSFIREKQINITEKFIDGGELSIEDTLKYNLEIGNNGIENLTINNLYSVKGNIIPLLNIPFQIEGMQKKSVELQFIPNQIGLYEDTVVVICDDPINSVNRIPFTVTIENYSKLVDNEDTQNYSEYGTWNSSVAQAFGGTSRYAYIQSTFNGPSASFKYYLTHRGIYSLKEIIPKTVNSANNALYQIIVDDVVIDSVFHNQNEGSGNWKIIGDYLLPANKPIIIKVKDSGLSTQGPVIRADAMKLLLVEEITGLEDSELNEIPESYKLFQNYPNPFNPTTTIRYNLPKQGFVNLKIYDILGNEVATLVNGIKAEGSYEIVFDASEFSSGVYFYKLQSGDFLESKKMTILK